MRSTDDEGARELAVAVRSASRLVFYGLLFVAVAVLYVGLSVFDGAGVVADRRLHYGMMVVIVAAFMIANRR